MFADKHLELKDLTQKDIVFWSLGNAPTQVVRELSEEIVLINLKALYLLSDYIIASASFFFESEITYSITHTMKNLFESGEILYFIDEDLESAKEHGEEKIKKSPKEFRAYGNKEDILLKGKKIDSFRRLLKRPKVSISDKMTQLWENEVLSKNKNTIGYRLNKLITCKYKFEEKQQSLINFAKNRKKDFVWDYVKPFLIKQELIDDSFHAFVRHKLSQMYAIATSLLLNVSLDENSVSSDEITLESKYDSWLFIQCLVQLGIKELIFDLNIDELRQLKMSTEFSIFKKDIYFSLIEAYSYKIDDVFKAMSFFEKAETFDIAQRNRFLNEFRTYCKRYNLPKIKFKKSNEIVENIRYNLETLSIKAISDFKLKAFKLKEEEKINIEYVKKDKRIVIHNNGGIVDMSNNKNFGQVGIMGNGNLNTENNISFGNQNAINSDYVANKQDAEELEKLINYLVNDENIKSLLGDVKKFSLLSKLSEVKDSIVEENKGKQESTITNFRGFLQKDIGGELTEKLVSGLRTASSTFTISNALLTVLGMPIFK